MRGNETHTQPFPEARGDPPMATTKYGLSIAELKKGAEARDPDALY